MKGRVVQSAQNNWPRFGPGFSGQTLSLGEGSARGRRAEAFQPVICARRKHQPVAFRHPDFGDANECIGRCFQEIVHRCSFAGRGFCGRGCRLVSPHPTPRRLWLASIPRWAKRFIRFGRGRCREFVQRLGAKSEVPSADRSVHAETGTKRHEMRTPACREVQRISHPQRMSASVLFC
ncbi:hypothetical protein Ga0080559_TMP2795 [Salipiger profundus]|uniref:Uncharacterized protein n=1 Tax=Salipiger profundus TaxID=1229727 RepID=A0A1U7D616_9RHOB|nr:hypothetical protein Ga0080559_TMP2795 [Salipiger profundus]